jgi:hypothetical protein
MFDGENFLYPQKYIYARFRVDYGTDQKRKVVLHLVEKRCTAIYVYKRCCGTVGWGTAHQTEKSRVRIMIV